MLKNTFLVTIFIVLSAVLGFFAQIVFASTFGASSEMDIYFKIFSVPAILTGISPIIFSSVLIPTFAKLKSDKLEINKFTHSMWILILVFVVIFVSVGFAATALNINIFIPNVNAYSRQLGVHISLMIWIGSGFMIMSSFLSALLNYNKEFFKVAWTSILPSLSMIFFVILFNKSIGVRSIAFGFCVGFILQFIIFFKASKISIKNFSFDFNHLPNKRLLLEQSFLVTLSLLPFTILAPIAYFWASKLEAGSISYLGYSQNFAGFLSVAVSMGISIVSFPELADKFANKQGEPFLYKFEQSLRYVLLIAMFAAGSLFVLRTLILSVFYQRGSFGIEDVISLSNVLPWYLLAAIFVGCLNLLRTLFYSKQEFKKIALLGLLTPFIFFILAGIFKNIFSLVGIGIAYAMTFAALFFISIYIAKNTESKFLTNNFYYFALKNTIAISAAIIFTSNCMHLFSNILTQSTSILVSFFLFLLIYILFSKFLFKLKEIEEIFSLLKNKLKLS